MANHKSAKKRIRRNDKFQLINKVRKTRVRTFIKKVESFIEKKDNLTDLSNLSYKKKSEVKVERYHQTFEDKNGFINDLCVLDLIFNYGPNAVDYLKRQAYKPDSV